MSRGFRFRGRSAASLALLFLLAVPTSGWAWGRIGHRVAGKVAWDRLNPAAQAAVKELLEPGESLADASTWADEHRREFPESSPWHYMDVPVTENEHLRPDLCPEAGCVLSAIEAQRKRLADKTLPRAERQKALRFLAHFVEDLHQPLHVGENHDKGGNTLQVQWFGQGSNLHRVWDSGVIEQHSKDEAAWLKEVNDLATPENAKAWSAGAVNDWAEESFQLARKAYNPPGSKAMLKSGAKLGDDYETFALPFARQRVAQSGVRLASVLNGVFPANP